MPVTAVDKALRMLGVRAYGEAELHQKLLRAGYAPEECEQAVSACRRHGFLNDELLAGDTVQLLLERGAGVRKIRQKLCARGLAPELVQNALSGHEEEERAGARAAAEMKLRLLRRETDPRKKREKLLRFLIGRGFSSGVIHAVLAELRSAPDPEEM